MNGLNFGSLTTPMGMGRSMGMGMRMPRMKPRGLGGLGMMRMAAGGLAEGGHPSMGWLAVRDALRSMPNHTVPDYMLARMASGGSAEDADPFRMPMRESADRQRLERYRPRISASSLPLESDEDWQSLRGLARPDREAAMLASSRSSDSDRQRAALYDLYNAGPLEKAAALEGREGLQDMGASLLDPTSLPLMFSGTFSKLGARALPGLIRKFSGSMPWKGRIGEFGAWNTTGPNISDARPGEMRPERRFGMEDLPSDTPMIGYR